MDICEWIPGFVIFFIMSTVFNLMVKSDFAFYWSIAYGVSATIVFFLTTRVYFPEHISTVSYAYYYANYLIAPMASFWVELSVQN